MTGIDMMEPSCPGAVPTKTIVQTQRQVQNATIITAALTGAPSRDRLRVYARSMEYEV
ncbi:unnamed protein product [Penicillium roqueforti FM164]|uniref:Genomic scaffold, ProqFM164S01 n=1 Tax=Penicillium roqueforti (strain FM164) TaxID=1365484 RepID=W6Q2R6_PENRF|nr:unnamed protein product [Penicillium roqueforti FM164]